jgi:hypothetical protein
VGDLRRRLKALEQAHADVATEEEVAFSEWISTLSLEQLKWVLEPIDDAGR